MVSIRNPKLPTVQSLGLDSDLEFADVGDIYEVRGTLLEPRFVPPHGLDAALFAAVARFPHQGPALRTYFERISVARAALSFAAGIRTIRPVVVDLCSRGCTPPLAADPGGTRNRRRGL